MKKQLNNLLKFKDFTGELPYNIHKKTKRTGTGLDILNENLEVPEEFTELINWFGNKVTPEMVIQDFNKCMDGEPVELIDFENGMFIGNDLYNGEFRSTPYDIFLQLNDYYTVDDDEYEEE